MEEHAETLDQDALGIHFDEKNLELWVTFFPETRLANQPPNRILGYARFRMAALKGEGLFDEFLLYEKRFWELWDRFCKASNPGSIPFVIAAGWRAISGLQIHPADADSGALCRVKLPKRAPEHPELTERRLRTWTEAKLRNRGLDERINLAQLQALWEQARLFPHQEHTALIGPTEFDAGHAKQAEVDCLIRPNSQKNCVYGRLYRLTEDAETAADKLYPYIEEGIHTLNRRGGSTGHWVILKDRLRQALAEGHCGAERLGLELPLDVLAAVPFPLTEPPHEDGDHALLGALVLRLASVGSLPRDPGQFAEALNLPWNAEACRAAVNMFYERGVLRPTGDGTHWSLREGVDPTASVLRGPENAQFHDAAMQKSQKAVRNLRPKNRELQALTLPLNERTLEACFVALQKLHDLSSEFPGEGLSDNVAQINVQFFPLSRATPDYEKARQRPQTPADSGKSHWCTTVIRELVALDSFSASPLWIAAKLRPEVSPAQAKRSFEFLKKAGLIRFDARKNRYMQTEKQLRSADGSGGEIMLDYHERVIQLAQLSPQEETNQQTWVSCHMVALPKARFKELRGRLREILGEVFTQSSETVTADRIFQLNLQAFLHLS